MTTVRLNPPPLHERLWRKIGTIRYEASMEEGMFGSGEVEASSMALLRRMRQKNAHAQTVLRSSPVVDPNVSTTLP